MEFIDKTGHIFSLPSYYNIPNGYEFETYPYIFWIDSEYSFNLSINNYYIRPIRVLVKLKQDEQIDNIEISINSQIYKLISSNLIQQSVATGITINKTFNINEDELKSKLYKEDICLIENIPDTNLKTDAYTFTIIPFYVIGYADEEGTWTSNILIKVITSNSNDTSIDVNKYNISYCPITVGGVFKDEIEELIINGRNMGVYLPKDILKAVYNISFYNEYPDEITYNNKIKEYLFNYMNIKGECGNFNSAINSLKWFGWGEHITLYKLLKNDNNIINQYVLDNFDIYNDTLNTYSTFKNTPNIALHLKENIESGEYDPQDLNTEDFWGEEHPIMKSLFDEITYDVIDNVKFYRSYYRYTLNEIGLKLSALKYYYDKYFLPIHLNIHSATIVHKTYMNDIKFINECYTSITEQPYLITNNNITVDINTKEHEYIEYNPYTNEYESISTKILDTNYIYLYNSEHYIDDQFNEFSNSKELSKTENIYHVNDSCIVIPIEFKTNNNKEGFYTGKIILEKDGKLCHESTFSFYQNDEIYYKNYIIYPKLFSNIYDVTNWIDHQFNIYVLCNDKWYKKSFELKLTNNKIEMGKLVYKYDNKFKQLSYNQNTKEFEFNSYMNDSQFVLMNDILFENKISKLYNKVEDKNKDTLRSLFNEFNEQEYINTINIQSHNQYYNHVILYNLFLVETVDKNNKEEYNIKEIEYKNQDDKIKELYHNFFYFNEQTGTVESNINIDRNIVNYDMFLMHDDNSWYIIFISQNTMIGDPRIYNIDKSDIPLSINGVKYILKYVNSSKNFLINRYLFESSNGYNHFNDTDIICARLTNDKLAFNKTIGTKWEVTMKSLGYANNLTLLSNNNYCIISIDKNTINNYKGVYNVRLNYCIDNVTGNYIEKKSIFRIE